MVMNVYKDYLISTIVDLLFFVCFLVVYKDYLISTIVDESITSRTSFCL